MFFNPIHDSQRSHDYLLQQGNVPSHTGVALPRPPLFEELRSEEKYLKRDFRLVPMLRVGTGLTLRGTPTLRDSTGLIGDV